MKRTIAYAAEDVAKVRDNVDWYADEDKVFFAVEHFVFVAGPDDTVWRVIYGSPEAIPSDPRDIDWTSTLNLHDDDIWLWGRRGLDTRTQAAHRAVANALSFLTSDTATDEERMEAVNIVRNGYDWPRVFENFEPTHYHGRV